jgi:type II secretory pathway pseudopilin PulG
MRIAIGLLAVLGMMASPALAGTIDLSSYAHGAKLGGVTIDGVTITATNNNSNHPNLPIVFDSLEENTADPDLESPFSKGNLSGQSLGKLIIIAENSTDANGDGLIDRPDDEAAGGVIKFSFANPITAIWMNLIDIEVSENGGFFAVIKSGGTVVSELEFSSYTESGNDFEDTSIVFGNHSANAIKPLTAAALSASTDDEGFTNTFTSFDSFEIHFKGSGAVGAVNFTVVPLPNAAWMGLGLIGFIGAVRLLRRRRRLAM